MIMPRSAGDKTLSERLGEWGAGLAPAGLPASTLDRNRDILIDITGLCLAARRQDYVRAVLAAAEAGGCTLVGHTGGAAAGDAALVNGTAAHGEDFDDTFEGGPVHCGAVTVPALLAAAESHRLDSGRIMLGLASGNELMCRLALTVPKGIHQAGFHPTAVLGAFAAAFGVAVACGSGPRVIANALGIAGSMASGIIEYLGDGSWTKRLHPGWSAQAGLKAHALAAAGFTGPRAVFEGEHGAFRAFAHPVTPVPGRLLDDLGSRYVSDDISFKPYPCGTMVQPYIDCARALRTRGIDADAIDLITCETAEGIVHRLWEPLAAKRRPPTPYAAKFSVPFGVALGLHRGRADLADFTAAAIADPGLLALAAKVGYVIDKDNPYPAAFTGHVRLRYKDGRVDEARQDFLRGGRAAPLSGEDIESKFLANAGHGGCGEPGAVLETCRRIGAMQGDYRLISQLGDKA